MPPSDIAAIVARVAASRRYRGIDSALVTRLAGEELPKARNLAEAEKRVKRRLHQIFGAYADATPNWQRALADLTAAHATGDEAAWRIACRAALALHASTRERLPLLERFYAEVFALTGPPATVVDLACGLNPLALPWMGLPEDCRYTACDIDRDLVGFVEDFLTLAGVPHDVAVCDIIASTSAPAALCPPCDVALLLKSAPCLEQQRAGVTRALLRELPARAIVVSYPTRSLGGHGKGMARTYRAAFAAAADGLERDVTELELPGELVYVSIAVARKVGE